MAVADKREITEQLNSSHGAYELVVSPVVLGLLGWWIDSKVGSGPWFAVGLAVFGVVGAVVKVFLDYKLRMAAVEEAARRNRAELEVERAAQRAVEAAERDAVAAELAAELAEAEAAASARRTTDTLTNSTRERVS